MQVTPIPKPKTYRSESYLAYVRAQRCLFCHKPGPSDPHHISMGDAAWGQKSSDLAVISLCREHHRFFHDNPKKFRETVDSGEIYKAMYWTLRGWVESWGEG